jgi:hypothetical protein
MAGELQASTFNAGEAGESMRCSGCGKSVPFSGVVCPYCQRDKSNDKNKQVIVVFFTMIGCLIGAVTDGIIGSFIGIFVGIVVGAIIGSIKFGTKTQPPEVRIANGPLANSVRTTITAARHGTTNLDSQPSPALTDGRQDNGNIGSRLRHLETLKSEGLISDAEFASKREAILASL